MWPVTCLPEKQSTSGSSLSFTGERLIPGLVEPQSWNEHISRYRYARLFAYGKRVLDIGCGTGYGTEELSKAAKSTVGFDLSLDALGSVSSNYGLAAYVQGSASSLPFETSSIDLITAFEVIEHLEQWEAFLEEAARVLSSAGVLLVSTPNIEFHKEARDPSGTNPLRVHELTYREFEDALKRKFPCVTMLAQNRQEAITFSSNGPAREELVSIPPANNVSDAHLFLAVCSFVDIEVPYFADVSSTHNLLREREKHIRGLQCDLLAAQNQYADLLLATRQELQHQQLEKKVAELCEELTNSRLEQELIKRSAWLRLGRLLGLGPTSDYRARLRAWIERRRADWNQVYAVINPWARFAGSIGAVLTSAMALAGVDISFAIFGKRRRLSDHPSHQRIGLHGVAVIIPNWNGVKLLKANLPALLKAASVVLDCEVVVVDNASDDGSAEFVRTMYPHVRLLCLDRNYGFAEACNTAARQVRSDVVVFLNNDMLVEDGFLPPLLNKFTDPLTFAVTSQIFFSDPRKQREETGLTELWWEAGKMQVSHRVDPLVTSAFPCAYAGGGSSAFDRAKFLQLGGFSGIFNPFYYEDTDLGYLAWKHGWKVLYEPFSVVHHKHRGTIGKHFESKYIDFVVRRNSMLFCWKNIHDWRLLTDHFASCIAKCFPAGSSVAQADAETDSVYAAFARLRQLLRARWKTHELSEFSDKETMLRPLGGYYRDRFLIPGTASNERLNVLFVSPYPIEPPVHGGAVFMREAITALQGLADVHVLSFVDTEDQLEAQAALLANCRSARFLVRPHFRIPEGWTKIPTAIREFQVREFAWALHRTIVLQNIDVVQLEYTIMGQYAGNYQNLPCMLFEHDISVQSLWRQIRNGDRSKAVLLEYLRMRSYEPKLLRRMTRVQVCSQNNGRYVVGVVGSLRNRIDCDVRAAIDTRSYNYSEGPRQPDSMLFVGSFRHAPNLAGLKWFMQEVLPLILQNRPRTSFYVVGSGAPEDVPEWLKHSSVRFIGPVKDVREPLQRYSVFICPVLTGSGVRVKLLEAFATGIPAVATTVGAEGLAPQMPAVCELADSSKDFANAAIRLLLDEAHRLTLSRNARAFVESKRDSRKAAIRLEAIYRAEVARHRAVGTERSDVHSLSVSGVNQ